MRRIQSALACLALLFFACGGVRPPLCPQPPPIEGKPIFDWVENQVTMTWDDMPVVVAGGSEANVLRRRIILDLLTDREVVKAKTFVAGDRGNVFEATALLYDDEGRDITGQSLHVMTGDPGCYDPDCYDAIKTEPHSGPPTKRIYFDVDCRVNDLNLQGCLTARCHMTATVTFAR